MATITLINKKENLDGSLRKRVFDMLSKLQADDTSVGAHVEPIKNAVDNRIRSVRVNDKFRALVFRIDGGAETHYVYVGTFPHDDAYDAAAAMQLRVNPVNGVLTLVREQAAALDAKVAAEQAKQVAAEEAAVKAEQAAAGGDQEETPDEGGTAVVPEGTSAAAPAVVDDPTPAFSSSGIDADVLSRELGIDPAVSELALSANTLSEVEAALDAAAPWERDALLGLAIGYSIDNVREELRLGDAAADEQADEFVRAVTAPASRMQFTFLGSGGDSVDVMREIIENGDFEAWTTFLHPTQEALATRYRNGAYRVSGGAGTGKTVVALHRTRALATRASW